MIKCNSDTIKKKALDLGFSVVGISEAEHLHDNQNKLNTWVEYGYHASMKWIPKRLDERGNIFNYFPEAKSVIAVGMNYYTDKQIGKDNIGKISNYAWGEDYHIILKNKLFELLKFIQDVYPSVKYRVCVDTSPIMDKVWAQKSGLGWQGKHTTLINKEYGSWLFLGELLLDITLDYDKPFEQDLCGNCTKCIDSCPTGALSDYILDSNKCISYLTIEHRGEFENNISKNLDGWIYGCDICQDVCPWNIKFSTISEEKSFYPREQIKKMDIEKWKLMTKDQFKKIFKKSPIKRTKFEGLKRNIDSVVKYNK